MRRHLILTALLVISMAAFAAEPEVLTIDTWLLKGEIDQVLPAFHADTMTLNDLPSAYVTSERPVSGRNRWTESAGAIAPLSGDETWLAVSIVNPAWLDPGLRLATAHTVDAWVDGEAVKLSEQEGVHSATLELQPGDHLLLVRMRRSPDSEEAWTLSGSLTHEPGALLKLSTDPAHAMTIRDALDSPRTTSTDLSPDGNLVAMTRTATDPEGHTERWFEIRSTRDGSLAETWRGVGTPSQVAWHPNGGALSYTSSADDKTTIWLYDLKSRETVVVARGLEDFENYAWNPDGRSLIYAFGIKEEQDKDNPMKRLEAIEDRWPWWRNRSFLMEITWPEGRTRQLTAGEVSAAGFEFDAAGDHLILSRSWPDPLNRPYTRTEWYELDLASLEVERILAEDEHWIEGVLYGPDPQTLIITGSPSAFGGLGRDLPEGVQPNDYGGQVFLYNRKVETATPLSIDFDPTVQQAVWHAPSKRIVARVLDTQYVRLATCTLDGQWSLLDTGVEVVSGWEVASKAKTIIARGTSITSPGKLYALDIQGGRPRLLLDPAAERFEHITFGDTKPFVATLVDGMELDGRVYYPRNYEQGKKYPVIVYYYGGTSPITRDFGGRYPKNIWAAHDYFVYVPNPSGALGYGQEYAARHVNDWGRLTAPEVIGGTKAFLAAHSDADADRVGCIGASYGGFLTMYLITQTDIFSAAISHAGISSISSYWAEGYWGYGYGARALAHSFPWNDRELYVEQSPLFHADAIHTPLLLLHGFDDTNVPRGESDGLYIALKMLDRDVQYVQVAGQDHHILDRDKRIRWNDTILAYFDWKLKGEAGWWDHIYADE